LFSDDVACDVRDQYRELIGDGLAGPQATDRLLSEWAQALDDTDDGPVVWLALAATQWRLGRLEPQVQQRALAIVDTGQDLDRWESPTDRRKRAAVLTKLGTQLVSPQPSPVKVRPPLRTTTPLRTGDAATYRLQDGPAVVLRVVAHVGDERDNYPIVEIADWVGNPPAPDPASLSVRQPVRPEHPELISIVQHRKGEFPADRIDIIKRGLPVTRRHSPATMIAWPKLDGYLRETFGVGWHDADAAPRHPAPDLAHGGEEVDIAGVA
jgi:hypothetical protein